VKALEVIKSVRCVTEDCSWCSEVKLFSEAHSAVNEHKVLCGVGSKQQKDRSEFLLAGSWMGWAYFTILRLL